VLPIVYVGFIRVHVCSCDRRESIVACGNDLVRVHDARYEENKVVRCYKLKILANAAAKLWQN
jgi:hypothetical protein